MTIVFAKAKLTNVFFLNNGAVIRINKIGDRSQIAILQYFYHRGRLTLNVTSRLRETWGIKATFAPIIIYCYFAPNSRPLSSDEILKI